MKTYQYKIKNNFMSSLIIENLREKKECVCNMSVHNLPNKMQKYFFL
jgi:hypothetical protein